VTFADAVSRLEAAFRLPLPGPAAQARMAVMPRRKWAPGFSAERVRNAAGLILVFPKKEATAEHAEIAEQNDSLRSPRSPRLLSDRDRAHIILTVRSESVRHGGQVSLPGGVVDPGETFEQAALREAHEEVALPLGEVRVLGELTPLDIPVSGFRLHPIVGVHPTRPTLSPSDFEVARILEIGVDELQNPRHFVTTERERDGLRFSVPAFRIAGVEIWGATAMVLAEFLALLD
jgi:8-oxo-dGTP pyrophosphatase MutT (NUDIX family)